MEVRVFKGKKILVVGMGLSGLASATYLQSKGSIVTVSEQRPKQELASEIQSLKVQGISYEVGGHQIETFLETDCIVVSPGVPLNLFPIKKAFDQGIEVISEVELAYRVISGKIIGITGSNGKTTTTTLVGKILKSAGFHVQVGGNIGVPLISLVQSSTRETINVVELSSFQLEAIPSFRPDIAVILNITPDHMDRYDSLENYSRAKFNILSNQVPQDFSVFNHDDPLLRQFCGKSSAKRYWFSTASVVSRGSYIKKGQMVFCDQKRLESVIDLDIVRLKGVHNLENIAAAVTVSSLMKCNSLAVRETVHSFRGIPHRLEKIRELNGVEFYNDSKATNLASTQTAIRAFREGIVLILGGRDKGSDFSILRPLIIQRVKSLVLLGEASQKIKSQLDGTVPVEQVSTMHGAVNAAFRCSQPGDVVLLAPACSSFDMFENYNDRGNTYRELVNQLQ